MVSDCTIFAQLHLYTFGHDTTERIEVFQRDDGERGVRSKRLIHENEFICEYESNVLTPSEAKQLEVVYRQNGDPIYMLQVRVTPCMTLNPNYPNYCRPRTEKEYASLMHFQGWIA